MSMFQRGQDAAQQAAADSAKRSQNNFVRTFFEKKDGAKKLVRFLDGDDSKNEPCTFPEHDVPVLARVKGKMKRVIKPFTCLKVVKEDCPFCVESPVITRYAYTILERDGYTNRDGKQIKDIRKLYVVGVKQFKLLETFRKEALDATGGKLTAQDIKIVRNGVGTATTYSYFAAGTPGKLKVDSEVEAREDFSAEPFDYEEMLKPISRADALNLLRGVPKEEDHRDNDDDDAGDEEQIPF